MKTIEKDLIKLEGTKFVDEFSKEIYEQTYRYGLEDINSTFYRIAKDLASVEKDPDYWTNKFQYLLEDFKFVPGGRIISNAGTGLSGTTYINCFVDGFIGEDQDSMSGIFDALRRQGLILKSEGGYGFCADVMRPRGAFIQGIGNESPGAVRMLDMWDTQSAVITEGSGKKSKKEKSKQKIRKGAQMVTMSCWHPDIEEFITAKQTSGRLTKFNMSVLITDDFMEAVDNNQP
jgi:ribonucleoside-diphosphate reductase alpha chain